MTVTGRVTPRGASQPAGARVLGVPPPLYYGVAFAAGMLLRATTIPLALGTRNPMFTGLAMTYLGGRTAH